MINPVLAALLTEMGDLLELNNDNVFKIRAYRRAAEVVENHPHDLSTLDRKMLLEIPGIGKGIADLILEVCATGKSKELEALKQKFPAGVLQVMRLPGLGAKRAALLFSELKIDSLDKLTSAAKSGKIQAIPGFGEKIQANILSNVAFAAESNERLVLHEALKQARPLLAHLKKLKEVLQVEIAGSARRWKETSGDIDFICASKQNDAVIDHFLKYSTIDRVLAQGSTKASVVLKTGLQCDLRVVDPSSYGAALLYFTGSKEHNVRLREIAQKKGLTLNEYGLYKVTDEKKGKAVAALTEEDIYKKLGMAWIPPELREDRGEIEAALSHTLPNLVTEADVKGDFHNHTTLSDGSNTLEEMVEAAQARGWSWFYSADHSPSLTIARGLTIERLQAKMKAVKKFNRKGGKFQVFTSSEVDILVDGRMDYPDDILKELDCVVASVHSRFKQTKDEMTARLIRAVEHPYVDILGHISGRRINVRQSYDLDYDAVLAAAHKHQTAVEVNGQPERSELMDIYVKKAIEMGVPLALNTDAHSTSNLDYMTYAVHIARRGWAEPKHLLNTMSASEIQKWLRR